MENKDKNIEHKEEQEDKVYQMRQSQIVQLVQQISKAVKLKLDEMKSVFIICLLLICIILYLIYDTNKQIKSDLLSTNAKIDFVLTQNTYVSKNMTALSGTICYTCHNNTKMFLPKTTLNLDVFVKYVRGERFVTNSIMPVFTEQDISYEKLQEIWKTLY